MTDLAAPDITTTLVGRDILTDLVTRNIEPDGTFDAKIVVQFLKDNPNHPARRFFPNEQQAWEAVAVAIVNREYRRVIRIEAPTPEWVNKEIGVRREVVALHRVNPTPENVGRWIPEGTLSDEGRDRLRALLASRARSARDALARVAPEEWAVIAAEAPGTDRRSA